MNFKIVPVVTVDVLVTTPGVLQSRTELRHARILFRKMLTCSVAAVNDSPARRGEKGRGHRLAVHPVA